MENGKATYNTYWAPLGDCSFFNCNYDILDYTIPSQFYRQLLLWWSQFRENFATKEDWKTKIWNNKEIKVENKSVYYKHHVNARVICIQDLLFSLNSTDSYNELSKKVYKTNILEWAGLRRSIPLSVRSYDRYPSTNSATFVVGDNVQHFWCYEREIKGLPHPSHQRKKTIVNVII